MRKIQNFFKESIFEMIGTAILMLFGISGCACSVLTHSSSNFPCAIAYGFGLILAAIFAGPVSGAHINPAVSLSFSVIGKLKWNKLFHYIIAQYIGSFIGSLLAWTIYHESIEAFDKIVNNATSPSLQTASIFITLPSPYISLVPAIFDQILSTGLLVFGVLFVSDQIHSPSLKLLQALINGSLLMALIFGFGYNCGAILNPARDLAPRIVLWLVGYDHLVFEPLNYNFWWAVGIIAPHIGAILGALLYHFLAQMRDSYVDDQSINQSDALDHTQPRANQIHLQHNKFNMENRI